MKHSITVLFLFALSIVSAQTKKETKQHRIDIETSLLNHTAIVSLDTFFCNGVRYAIVNNPKKVPMNGIAEQCFSDLKTGDTLITVKLIKDDNSLNVNHYYHFYFPTLKSDCDIMFNPGVPEPFETICKYSLLNANGLDTFMTETFVTIKGNYRKKIESEKDAVLNFKTEERNINKRIKVIGENIYQDSMIIGSFEESTVQSPDNGILRQIRVYNKQKQMVCFSTETKKSNHEWRTITNQDSKYHKIKSTEGKDLYDLLGFLVANLYL